MVPKVESKIKEKVKDENDKKIANELFFIVEKVRLGHPYHNLGQETSSCGIQDCMDFKDLKSICINYPFPTPFSDEFLDQVKGRRKYSFTNNFRISSGVNSGRGRKENTKFCYLT